MDRLKELKRRFLEYKPTINEPFLDEQESDFYKLMNALDPREGDKVLYIGSGSGYGSYVISNLVGLKGKVLSYDIDEETVKKAYENAIKAGCYDNIEFIVGDAFVQPQRPDYFDRIIVVAGGRLEIPEDKQEIEIASLKENGIVRHLVRQTKVGGRIVLPMGELHTRWFPECEGHTYIIDILENRIKVNPIDHNIEFWSPLIGEFGFSKKEMEENLKKEKSLFDELI